MIDLQLISVNKIHHLYIGAHQIRNFIIQFNKKFPFSIKKKKLTLLFIINCINRFNRKERIKQKSAMNSIKNSIFHAMYLKKN